MENLAENQLSRLVAHRLDGFDAGPGAVYPNYHGFALNNIPAAACHWLGVPLFGDPPLDDEILALHPRTYRHVILLVIDGLGWDMLAETLARASTEDGYAVWPEIAERGALVPLTSISPSTTAAALTTFWTGRAPGAHGVMAYEVWLKEYGVIANMILQSPASFRGDVGSLQRAGFDPQTFLPAPTLGPHLARHGVQLAAFQHRSIARSGLSTMLLPGVDVHPFHSLSDLFVSLEAMLDARSNERGFTYIYWGELDEHAHRFGPRDRRVSLELASFSRQLETFLERRRPATGGDTLLLITADHGHLPTPRRPQYELRSHPDLLDCLVMIPSGEARLPFVYLRPGAEERFLRYLEHTWPGEFLAVPSAQAARSGLFGPGESYRRTADRIGDYLVIPQGEAYWWFGSHDNLLLGRHGGLSRTEMLVPFLSLEIS